MKRLFLRVKKWFEEIGKIHVGKGIVIEVEDDLPELEDYNPFFRKVCLIPCEDIPHRQEHYRLRIAMGGKAYICHHNHFMAKGSVVCVKYRNELFGRCVLGITHPKRDKFS